MTKDEYNEAAALVVRLRKELEHTNQHLVAHIDALSKSNAQCGEYLRRNEQLQAAKDEMQNALAEAIKDLAYSRLAVDTMRARDKRFTETIAKCGAAAGEDIGDFIERTAAERDKLHSELVEVRAALASVTEQRDSLQRTLDEWERADTKPHERVAADDVADHVVPPVLDMCMTCHECGGALRPSPAAGSHRVLYCRTERCSRKNTAWRDELSPYHGPCKSATPVRHE